MTTPESESQGSVFQSVNQDDMISRIESLEPEALEVSYLAGPEAGDDEVGTGMASFFSGSAADDEATETRFATPSPEQLNHVAPAPPFVGNGAPPATPHVQAAVAPESPVQAPVAPALAKAHDLSDPAVQAAFIMGGPRALGV